MDFGDFLIVGSLCAHSDDREMDRKDLISVQVVTEGEVYPITFFNEFGTLGISSMAFRKDNPLKIYFSTGDDLMSIDLLTKSFERYDVEFLKDVHEIFFIGDDLWIANTAINEAVVFNTTENKIVKRFSLCELINDKDDCEATAENSIDHIIMEDDKFHFNAVFKGLDNDVYALVHNYNGKQRTFLSKVRNKLLKIQGNGGVINLSTGKTKNLELSGPHSVRILNNSYWIFSSAKGEIHIFNKNWEKTYTLNTAGFGRGGDFSLSGDFFYAGISATRKRYIDRIPKHMHVVNMVEVFDVKKTIKIFEFPVEHVEQLNNIYTLTADQRTKFLNL